MALFTLDDISVDTPENNNFWIAPNATVIGNVKIEEDASVWFNAVIRGDNERIMIGRGSNVQDGCVLHSDPGFPLTIGEDCTIGHMAMLHGCSIGKGALIAIGATVLNGAVIGEYSIIGAHALIPEGKVIPPRSVVMGAPGKVVREATNADIEQNQRTSSNYQRNWRRFSNGMMPQNSD